MPGFIETAFVAGAVQFDGTAGLGLFTWQSLDGIPETTRVVIRSLSYAAESGGASGDVIAYLRPNVGVTPNVNRVLVGRALQADITGPDGQADVTFCDIVVPRSATSGHYRLHVLTTGKAVDGQVTVDWTLQPYPDTSREDSP